MMNCATEPLGTSEMDIELPRSQDYERIMLWVYTGSNRDGTFAPAAGLLDNIRFVVNDTVDLIPKWTEAYMLEQQAYDYDTTLSAGLYVIDLMREWNSRRDVLPR